MNATETQSGSSLDPLVSRRGHKLLTTQTCKCDKRSDRECSVCDWGLGVCEWCGAAECELDERDCTGKPANVRMSDGGHETPDLK